MLNNIFDLSYERNIIEAVVFYFCYVIFAIYLWILSICLIFYFVQDPCLQAILLIIVSPLVPLFFYNFIAICLCIKKNFRDRHNIIFATWTVLLTFAIPALTGIILSLILSPTAPHLTLDIIIGGTFGGIILFFISEIFLGCIPLAMLSTKECLTNQKIMHKMDQERIRKEKHVEKLLFMEQLLKNNLKEKNNDTNE